MAAVADFTLGIRDDTGRVGFVKYHGIEWNAGNIAAEIAKVSALQSAAVGLSLGTFASRSVVVSQSASQIRPTDPVNLGDKWLVASTDADGNVYFHTIPAQDNGVANANVLAGTHDADLSSAAWVAYIAAYDAFAVSRQGDDLTFAYARLATRLGK